MVSFLAGLAAVSMAGAGVVDSTPMSTSLRIELKSLAQVPRADVTLADIAQISSPSLDTLRRAMALSLGKAPRAGEVVFLERNRVRHWLRGQTGLGAKQVQWSGASVTEISRLTSEIAGVELLAVAQTALRKHLESMFPFHPAPRIELQAVAIPANLVIPAASSSLVVRPLAKSMLSSRMLVWVDAFAGGQYVRSVSVRFEVGAFMPVPVATRALPGGVALQSVDWQEHEVDVTRVPDAVVSFPPSTLQRMRRPIRSGDVITHAHLQTFPAVSRGEWANLTTQAGLVVLESKVEVMQDGQVGQLVRVKPTNGNGSVVARVIGPGNLEMQP